jgi:hypothetical protein
MEKRTSIIVEILSVVGKHCKRMCFSILGCEIKGLDKQRGVSFCVEFFFVLVPYIFKDSLKFNIRTNVNLMASPKT